MDHSLISRIDRAVADNLKDIQRSFGDQAGIVQDFIVFITRQLKTDLFGYTRFTMQQFCLQTGRSRQDLAMIIPDFSSGLKRPPLIRGYAFQTVLEFALYCMLERNIIFSNRYEVKGNGEVLQMHNFPILKDLKLNFDRKSKEQKIYDVRLSDEMMTGFLSRYYTINADSYRLVGKGRGGDSRKALLIYLSKVRHILLSAGTDPGTTIPLDRLCYIADIRDSKPSHKKQNLVRMLKYLQDVGKFPFRFEFTGRFDFMVRLAFDPPDNRRRLGMEHTFYYRLLAGLRSVYDLRKTPVLVMEDNDPFQYWLTDPETDTLQKAQVLMQAYYIAFQVNLSQSNAVALIRSGDFLRPLLHVG